MLCHSVSYCLNLTPFLVFLPQRSNKYVEIQSTTAAFPVVLLRHDSSMILMIFLTYIIFIQNNLLIEQYK